ncbi:uncharacterized protein LOC114165617 [Vigna unguiculata]|uniref:uncharacterized protein LOC114165617 n=1 Tax=Vigna unguiculata TaxID=3917 RepID=UPI001016FC43|nr:uncharacterized protein LOC114165617 [Vigna unguiculata]
MGPADPFSLKKLSLSELPNLKNVWNENPHRIMSMHNLEEIHVEKCERLTCVIPPIEPKDLVELEDLVEEDVLLPFSLLPFLTNLVTFEVNNCDSVKAIIGVKCTTQDTITFGLKNLTLYDLPNLENVWNEDPRGILNMNHLQEVNVMQCRGLTNVFPASIAQDLLELKNLEVEDCKELMTIVAEDDTDPSGANEDLPCPLVRSLELKGLPMFKYFYYSSRQCDNFAHLESHTENQVSTKKSWKCLSVGKNGVEMILRGEIQRNLLHNLDVLTLCLGSDVFGYKILEEVPNIEKLVVCDDSFKEMFCCESGNNVLQQLKVLQLESLGELVSIGLENSWTDSFVRNLETFEVIKCGSLKSLPRVWVN